MMKHIMKRHLNYPIPSGKTLKSLKRLPARKLGVADHNEMPSKKNPDDNVRFFFISCLQL